ncbi:hypothetical protein DPX16_14279 [Anabarilius grahami]|uniref:Uncharacterized protein n=1 Tax=Anabarilius grahami TaxID=495550 RepID=A0A3N0XFA9_ANAGA|nr:hypothetical protein DPX16_14279 [Anabarilius grahami]
MTQPAPLQTQSPARRFPDTTQSFLQSPLQTRSLSLPRMIEPERVTEPTMTSEPEPDNRSDQVYEHCLVLSQISCISILPPSPTSSTKDSPLACLHWFPSALSLHLPRVFTWFHKAPSSFWLHIAPSWSSVPPAPHQSSGTLASPRMLDAASLPQSPESSVLPSLYDFSDPLGSPIVLAPPLVFGGLTQPPTIDSAMDLDPGLAVDHPPALISSLAPPTNITTLVSPSIISSCSLSFTRVLNLPP